MIVWMLWSIGFLFTVGITVDPTHKSAAGLILTSVVVWPLLLGCYIKSRLEDKGGNNQMYEMQATNDAV